MRRASLVFLVALASPSPRALADGKKAGKAPVEANRGAPRVKTYDFSGLDIEGKLKTPQLLYFLHRMEAELDATTPTRRSFLPELRRSSDEM